MPLRYNSPDCPVCHAEQRLQRQRSSAKVNSEATVRGQRAQSQSRRQKAHRIVNSDCPVHHRTVRWPHLSELQRSNPNGWVTWLAHRTVSGGAPDCPVHPSIDSLPNDHFCGWGYKYPQPPHFKASKFSANTFNTKLVHSIQDTIRLNQSLSRSQFHSKQLVTGRESFARVL
jgi:hypothetical protein